MYHQGYNSPQPAIVFAIYTLTNGRGLSDVVGAIDGALLAGIIEPTKYNQIDQQMP